MSPDTASVDGTLSEPDIVTVILQRVCAVAPGFTAEQARQVEQEVRADYGGRRVFVPKGMKHLTIEQRQALYADGLTAMPTADITKKYKISRATLYRAMKNGRFGG